MYLRSIRCSSRSVRTFVSVFVFVPYIYQCTTLMLICQLVFAFCVQNPHHQKSSKAAVSSHALMSFTLRQSHRILYSVLQQKALIDWTIFPQHDPNKKLNKTYTQLWSFLSINTVDEASRMHYYKRSTLNKKSTQKQKRICKQRLLAGLCFFL